MKRLGRDEKRWTADSFAIFKPSANPAMEQLIGQFMADDRSLTVQGASLFIFTSLPNITFVWPPDRYSPTQPLLVSSCNAPPH